MLVLCINIFPPSTLCAYLDAVISLQWTSITYIIKKMRFLLVLMICWFVFSKDTENYLEYLREFGTFSSFLLTTIIHIISPNAGLDLFKSHMWDYLMASCASKCQSYETEIDTDDQRERKSRTFQSSIRS